MQESHRRHDHSHTDPDSGRRRDRGGLRTRNIQTEGQNRYILSRRRTVQVATAVDVNARKKHPVISTAIVLAHENTTDKGHKKITVSLGIISLLGDVSFARIPDYSHALNALNNSISESAARIEVILGNRGVILHLYSSSLLDHTSQNTTYTHSNPDSESEDGAAGGGARPSLCLCQ